MTYRRAMTAAVILAVLLATGGLAYRLAPLTHRIRHGTPAPPLTAWQVLMAQDAAARERRRDAGMLWGILLCGAVAGAASLIRPDRRPRQAAIYGSHGTARWATGGELDRRLRADGAGIIIGRRAERWQLHPLDSPLNQFVMVIGGAGSRKSRGYVVPNVLHEREASLVVTDPKGEVFRLTAAAKREHGYQVKVLNLCNLTASHRYNPLSYIRTPHDALRLAATVIQNTRAGRPAAGDPFWEEAEKALLTALILYVTELPAAQRHLSSVLELGTVLARDQQQMDAVFDRLPPGHPALRQYNVFRLATDRTRSGILIGFAVRLQLWTSTQVAALTAANDFGLADLGTAKIALYLLLPDAEVTYAPLTALFFTQLFQELYRAADDNGGRLKRRVRLILDEFCNLGFIGDYEKRVSTCRGRGISPEMVIQSLGQLINRYPDQLWSEILASCDTLLYLGSNDTVTARHISERLGQTTVQVDSTSLSDGVRGATTGESRSYTSRPLLTVDEVLALPRDELILIQPPHPARLHKGDYTQHPAVGDITPVDPNGFLRTPDAVALVSIQDLTKPKEEDD